jgi:uncharacterized protein YggT (Ycf19 family)
MSALDFLLNLAGLLLWLSWRSLRFAPQLRSSAGSLVGTLKPTEFGKFRGWPFLAGLAALLLVRAWGYWQIGGPAGWIPKLHLGWVVLAFPRDSLPAVALFSLLSLIRLCLVFYFWLLVLCIVNRNSPEPDPVQAMLRLHLGSLARWPWALKLVLLPVLAAAFWIAIHPLLTRLNMTDPALSFLHLLEQGLLVGGRLFVTLKFLLPAFLFLYLVASYIYFGKHPVWDFVFNTAKNLLAPFRSLPLRFAKLDFAPIAAVGLLFLVLEWLPNVIDDVLARQHLSLWPQ